MTGVSSTSGKLAFEQIVAFPDLPRTPLPEADPNHISERRRLTKRQHDDVAAGRHPLLRGLKLAGNGETCGSCIHRVPTSAKTGQRWPKCEQHVTHGAASDCRKWWPACVAWKGKG
jgi:hypothetical protein